MSLAKLIAGRKSVRKYSGQAIPKEDVLKCLEAARLAPSACNSQPWKFIVIDKPELKDRICGKIFSGIYSINKFASEAPVLIAVVSERGTFLSAVGGQIRDTRYYLIDIGIACEHLILQAEELGIGSCWIGWFDEKPLKEILRIPKDKKIDIVISLGYSRDPGPAAKIRKPMERISAFNGYG